MSSSSTERVTVFLGVDPGASGGIGAVDEDGRFLKAWKMPDEDAQILGLLTAVTMGAPARALLERVSSSPQMGVVSAFSFGGSYHELRMALTATKIPYEEITPLRWQRLMGCLSGRDKNVTKARAQQLFPTITITHATADALLLAELCRRLYIGAGFLEDA